MLFINTLLKYVSKNATSDETNRSTTSQGKESNILERNKPSNLQMIMINQMPASLVCDVRDADKKLINVVL
jgi:hypothetical protein